MRNTAGRRPAFADSALSVPRWTSWSFPRLRRGRRPGSRGPRRQAATLTSPAQPTGTALELSVWESDGGRLASPTDAT